MIFWIQCKIAEKRQKKYWNNIVDIIYEMNYPKSFQDKADLEKSIKIVEEGIKDMQKKVELMKMFVIYKNGS